MEMARMAVLQLRVHLQALISAATIVVVTLNTSQTRADRLATDLDVCIQVATNQLKKAGIKDNDVAGFHLVELTGNTELVYRGNELYVVALEYWFQLKRCDKGAVIVELNKQCVVRQVYSRGGCVVDGIEHFR
jgi:hypothetical protein